MRTGCPTANLPLNGVHRPRHIRGSGFDGEYEACLVGQFTASGSVSSAGLPLKEALDLHGLVVRASHIG